MKVRMYYYTISLVLTLYYWSSIEKDLKARTDRSDVSIQTGGSTGGKDRVDFVQWTESLPKQNEFPCVL